ncbi:MAG: patatin-like phospholipase family protein [Cyclobacteriaceae bacterium]
MKIGLVLSGGGARCLAHLGILEALVEHGVTYDVISGASAGAIMGSLLAEGFAPSEIAEILQKTSLLKIVRPSFNLRGLLHLDRASTELKRYIPHDSFEGLKIPLYVSTTDIMKGTVKVYKRGKLIKPLLASSSIPVIFDPIRIKKKVLVDGGILDNLPVKPIIKRVDRVIGLHCNPIDPIEELSGWKSVFERTMMLAITQVAYTQKKYCDLFLEPPGLSFYNVFDFGKSKEIFDIGYAYAKGQIANGAVESLR